jgi:GTP cyclohydrolase II
MHAGPQARPIHGALLHVGTHRVETRRGAFPVEVFRDLVTRHCVLVLTRGDVRRAPPLLARVHLSCTAGECMGARDCDCADQLDAALAAIASEGRGAIFFLMQEGRGAGLVARARNRMIVQSSRHCISSAEAYELMGIDRDLRRYESVAFARRLLGVTAPLRLLTDDAEMAAAIEAQGLHVDALVPVGGRAAHGEACDRASAPPPETDAACAGDAELPEKVSYFDPHPLPDAPRFLRMASHLLPVGVPGEAAPLWFRLHAYLDRESGAERAVLTCGGQREPRVRFQRDALLGRIAGRAADRAACGWHEAARHLVQHGAGCAVFLPPQLEDEGPALPDAAALALVAHHVKGRRAQLLVDASEAAAVEGACAEALHRCGIALDPSLVLGAAL